MYKMKIRLLLLRSLQTAWDRFGRTGMFEVGGVAVLLGTTVLTSANRSCGHRLMLVILAVRARPVCAMAVDPRVGQFSSNYAEEPDGTGSDGV